MVLAAFFCGGIVRHRWRSGFVIFVNAEELVTTGRQARLKNFWAKFLASMPGKTLARFSCRIFTITYPPARSMPCGTACPIDRPSSPDEATNPRF